MEWTRCWKRLASSTSGWRLLSQARHQSRAARNVRRYDNDTAVEGPPAVRTERQPAYKRQRLDTAQRDLFIDVLSVNATRRDAKQYLSRFKQISKQSSKQPSPAHADKEVQTPGTSVTAIETSPQFKQHDASLGKAVTTADQLCHLALVSVRHLDAIEDEHLAGMALTLSQLVRLDMHIVITFDCKASHKDIVRDAAAMRIQGQRLARAIASHHAPGARYVDAALNVSDAKGQETLSLDSPPLLFHPLFQDIIPILPPIAYTQSYEATVVERADIMSALTTALSDASKKQAALPDLSLDRIIMIDPNGGIPSSYRADGAHAFVNLDQEYDDISKDLSINTAVTPEAAESNIDNLRILRRCLRFLPPASSALIISPDEASTSSKPSNHASENHPTYAGTRRQRNPLIHNLLTNRPVISSSLPVARVTPLEELQASVQSGPSRSTLVKRGMPVTMVPDPRKVKWVQPRTGTTAILLENNPKIHFPRLLHLVEDSFRRRLDTKAYLERVNHHIAGVIVAGEYEGGAILTWEQPDKDQDDASRLVPYLDKFAVLQKAQGNAGVADIVFQAMVRTCLPQGVCWRSRSDNPVNKWYFERSIGTWKLPGGQWTMFWTTPNEDLVLDKQKWLDYVTVCQGVVPTWADDKKPE